MNSSIDSKEKTESKWVIVELSSSGERETNINTISNAVHKILGQDLEVFVPAVSRKAYEGPHASFYMDGYVFIKYKPGIQYARLQDTSYFGHVLLQSRNGSGVAYSLIDDQSLDPLRKGVKNLSVCKFSIGDEVRVIKGEFRNLRGNVKVIYEGGDTVQVDVSQRSKLMLIDFPVIFLQKVS